VDFSGVFVDLMVKILDELAAKFSERTIDPAKCRPELSFCDGGREHQLPEFESGEGLLILGKDAMEKTRAAPGSAQYEDGSFDRDIAIASEENVIDQKTYPVQNLNEEKQRDKHGHSNEPLDCDTSLAAIAVKQGQSDQAKE